MNDFMLRISGKLGAVLAFALVLGVSARADDASATLYKAKCAGCHGAELERKIAARRTITCT
jgi:cytochrome c553